MIIPLILLLLFSQTISSAHAESNRDLMIHDFEKGSLESNLGSESGSWDEDPEDDSADCIPEVVPDEGPLGSRHALKLTYDVDAPEPSSNGFWVKLKSLDASRFDHIEFDVRGDAKLGFTNLFKIELKRFKDKERIEKLKGSFVVKEIGPEWKHVSVPLNALTGLLDFSNPSTWKNPSIAFKDMDEFVIAFETRRVSQKEGVIYLDNIRFTQTGEPGPSAVDQPERIIPKTETWMEGVEFAKFLVKRLKDYPKQSLVKKEFPRDDREFLTEIAKDTWRFFDEVVDKEHHLVLDTIQIGKPTPVAEDGWVGDYLNVTNIGLYFMVIVSAYDFGFIGKEDAVNRIKATIKTMRKLEHHASGFPYNYYDTTTLERTSHFVSFVDSAWLAAGLVVAKNAFPEEAGPDCEDYLEQFNFGFFYDPVQQQMFHGYYAHMNQFADYHYGTFYSETRAGSYLAIGLGQVPMEYWFRTFRTFPENYTWQSLEPVNRKKKNVLGFEFYDGYYEWRGLKLIPSWGGSMFEALMPALVLDEYRLSPDSLGLNNRHHVEGQILYALDVLKYPVWGLSPSATPEGGYTEYGAKPLGSKGYKAGAVSPHASVLAVEVAPELVITNLRRLIERYDIYGEYGFYDAVNPETGRVSQRYLALDQAMIFIALNNYLNDEAIRKRFARDPLNQKAKVLLTEEKLFE